MNDAVNFVHLCTRVHSVLSIFNCSTFSLFIFPLPHCWLYVTERYKATGRKVKRVGVEKKKNSLKCMFPIFVFCQLSSQEGLLG